MNSRQTPFLFPLVLSLAAAAVVGADRPPAAFSAAGATVFHDGREAYALPLGNIGRETRRLFSVGNSFFNENWAIAPASAQARDGLGPLHNALSCSACHVKDGRGAPPEEGQTMLGLLLRLSVPGEGPHGGPRPDPTYGLQLAVQGIPGAKPEAIAPVKWIHSSVTLADGETVALRRPEFGPMEWRYGPPSPDLLIGPRLAQPVYGSGLLEAVPEADILALADPDDANKDGISGRVNMVWSLENEKPMLGRFGWKANQPTIRQQTADAFVGDLGITTSIHPNEDFTEAEAATLAKLPNGGSPELNDRNLDRVVTYLRALGVPARRRVDDPVNQKGEALFTQLKCAVCHHTEFTTGADAALPELRSLLIRPYTDLLVHDMGPDLADGRTDFQASGSEWRTQPLWGIGLNAAVNGNTFFLHDGRARNLTEAILWHGGEAESSLEEFKKLSKEDRAALVSFLESL